MRSFSRMDQMNWKFCITTSFVLVTGIFVAVVSKSQPPNPFDQSFKLKQENGDVVEGRVKIPKLAAPTDAPSVTTHETDDQLASMETEAFKLAQNPDSYDLARELFFDILQTRPTDTLAAQMVTELSRTRNEKEQTVSRLLSVFSECSSCSELGLIAADLLLELERESEARHLSKQLTQSVTSESEKRHLASLLVKTGDLDEARANLEKLATSRKRLKTRLGTSNPAEIIWEKIDQAELNSLTAPGG